MTAPEQMRACPTPWCSHDCTPYTWQGPSDYYTVICEECQVEGPYCATESEAITAWNTRPAPAELVEAAAKWRDLAVRAIDCLHDVERETEWGQPTFGPSVWEHHRQEMDDLLHATALRNAGAAS